MHLMKRAFLATLLVFGCVMATSSAQAGPLGKVKTANGTPIVGGGGGSNPGNGVSRNGSPGNSNGGVGNFAGGNSATGSGTGNSGQHHGPTK